MVRCSFSQSIVLLSPIGVGGLGLPLLFSSAAESAASAVVSRISRSSVLERFFWPLSIKEM